MTRQFTFNRIIIKKIVFHSLYWIIFFLILFIPVWFFNSGKFAFLVAFGVVLPCTFPVYINFYLLDKYLKKRKYFNYWILLIILVILSGAFAQYFIYLLVPLKEGEFFGAFADPLFVIIITSGIRYYWQGIKLQIQLHEVQAKQYKAELDLLKYQVNPHFFFNTLNNLFSMARKQKDYSTSKGIAKLSHLIRYVIYDCNVDKIDLEKEIEQINNFLDLQKLRFSKEDKINISFEINGQYKTKQISPMLLIPFVENAFKHGISFKNDSPIDIKLNINNNLLLFSVKNNVNRLRCDRDDHNSGIGLANIQRRLELLYPESHHLKIENKKDTFEIILSIEL